MVPSEGAVQISTSRTLGLVLGNSTVQRLTVSARMPEVQSVESESLTGAARLMALGLSPPRPQAAETPPASARPESAVARRKSVARDIVDVMCVWSLLSTQWYARFGGQGLDEVSGELDVF